jgi:hypothetical protein
MGNEKRNPDAVARQMSSLMKETFSHVRALVEEASSLHDGGPTDRQLEDRKWTSVRRSALKTEAGHVGNSLPMVIQTASQLIEHGDLDSAWRAELKMRLGMLEGAFERLFMLVNNFR